MSKKLNPWYVTGLFDGEGYFKACIQKPYGKHSQNYFHVDVGLIIAFRIDDIEILTQLREYFDCGWIGYRKPKNRAFAQAWYRINHRRDLIAKVLPHFDKYLPQNRTKFIYPIWRQIVLDADRLSHVGAKGARLGGTPQHIRNHFFNLIAECKKQREWNPTQFIQSEKLPKIDIDNLLPLFLASRQNNVGNPSAALSNLGFVPCNNHKDQNQDVE